jgi:DNA polymerase-1
LIYLDLEANGLTPDTIWCVVTRENGVSQVHTNRNTLCEALAGSVSVCGHNLIGYDLPVLKRLWGLSVAPERVVDTLVLSRLFDPSRQGGHSLRAWGETLGFPKGDHNDWSCLSPEMIDYCIQDVAVTEAVHQQLVKDMVDFSPECIELEHKVQYAVQEQERNGWVLDQQLANELCATFKEGMNAIEAELQEMFPPIVEKRISEKTGKRLKDKVTVFNVGSRQQVAGRLATKGAVWNETTPSGKPVVDEKTLRENAHVPEAAKVLEYLTLQKRYAQVHSWLEAVEEDGRVHGRVISNGAVTGRMTHQSPNMAQVPASHSLYGHECRSCWTVPEGKKLVGFDAREIKWLLDLKQDLKLKLSFMLSSTEPETQKLELSLEELQEMAELLSNDFYETHLLLKVYENALLGPLGVVILQDLTEEDLELDQNMLH